ncbi:MAG: MltA domain-containing protein [Proteobacteria bacterium]|nr:MltA domain-containing protein [Pseudomonadota bacterium]
MVSKVHLNFFALFLLLAATGCLLTYLYVSKDSYQPLHQLRNDEPPSFADDMDRTSLIECTRSHISYLKRQDPEKTFNFGTVTYSNSWLLHSVENFLDKLNQNPSEAELQSFISGNYLVYQAGGRKDQGHRRMLVTGYYEPIFEGSLTRTPPFLTPIYSPPHSLVTVTGANGEPQVGRYDHNGRLTAFWNRKEIETTFKLLQGDELAFLRDPFDAFLLHVQGSGKIQFPDKSIRAIHFAASNGLEYKSIGKLLVDEKAMTLEEVTIPAIRTYLQQHPEQQQRILHHNPRFIFFNWSEDDLGPKGSSGEVLTPGRSIAIDGTALPGGALGYLVSRTPRIGENGQITGWSPLARFVFSQDSGAAIKGTGRVDIFFGHGKDAEFSANHMKETGKLYFLVKKPPHTPH